MQIKFAVSKNVRIFAIPIREHSSVGLEHLPYKQRVGGSTPSAPTRNKKVPFLSGEVLFSLIGLLNEITSYLTDLSIYEV